MSTHGLCRVFDSQGQFVRVQQDNFDDTGWDAQIAADSNRKRRKKKVSPIIAQQLNEAKIILKAMDERFARFRADLENALTVEEQDSIKDAWCHGGYEVSESYVGYKEAA